MTELGKKKKTRIKTKPRTTEFYVKKIRRQTGNFLVISIHIAMLVLAIVSIFSTLITGIGTIPYGLSLWLLLAILYYICLTFDITKGRFTTVFWVGLIFEILMLLYMIYILVVEIIYGYYFINSLAFAFRMALFIYNAILWFSYIRVIVVTFKIRKKFKKLNQRGVYVLPTQAAGYDPVIYSNIQKKIPHGVYSTKMYNNNNKYTDKV